jgi:competence protein ComEC
MPGRWGDVPFTVLAASLAAGIWLAQYASGFSFPCAAAACIATGAAACTAFRAGRLSLSMCLSIFTVVQCGALLAVARRDAYPAHDARALLAHGTLPLNQPVGFDACVAEERSREENDVILRVDLRALRTGTRWDAVAGGAILRVPAAPDGGSVSERFPRYGDRIRGFAMFDVRRDYENPGDTGRSEALARRGVFLVGRVKSSMLLDRIPGDCGGWWDMAAFAVRNRLEARLAGLQGQGSPREAAILASILVGDYSDLDADTREAFQNSGTFHVLVVSGLHVGWLAWALLHVLRFCRCPELVTRILVAAAILFYTSVIGFQASISRSFWMFSLYVLGQALSRRSSPVNIAGAAGFGLLAVNPDWLFDAGFQLSFLSVTAICLLGAPTVDQVLRPVFDPLRFGNDGPRRRFRITGPDRLGRKIRTLMDLEAEALGDRLGAPCERLLLTLSCKTAAGLFALAAMLVISLSVQAWIEPALACRYNRLSWIAPVANLAIVPMSSVVLAAGIFALVSAGVPLLSPLSLDAAVAAARLLYRATRAAAAIPLAWQRCPTPAWQWVVAAVLVLAFWTLKGWRRQWLACTVSMTLIVMLGTGFAPSWIKPPDPAAEPLKRAAGHRRLLSLTFLDVGQGDCTVLTFPDGRTWVVDAGGIRQETGRSGTNANFDIGEAVVSRFLWHCWIPSIDRLVITHPHQDHAGGARALVLNFPVRTLECPNRDPLLAAALSAAGTRGTRVSLAQPGEAFRFGAAAVEVLCPPPGLEGAPANETSVVMKLTYGRFSALLTGDMEKSEEQYLLRQPESLDSMLLKVAHHGSRFATLDPLLDRVRPRWAVISAARNNPFGVPARPLMMRLLRHGARPFLTMDHGAVSVATDGCKYVLWSHVGGVLEAGSFEAQETAPNARDAKRAGGSQRHP